MSNIFDRTLRRMFRDFFDPNELEALLEATVSNVFTINKSRLDANKAVTRTGEQGAFYIKCPVCGKIMNRVNFGTNSGVINDLPAGIRYGQGSLAALLYALAV